MANHFLTSMSNDEAFSFARLFVDRFVSAYYVGLDDLSCKTFVRTDYLDATYPLPANYLDSVLSYIESDVADEDKETMRRLVQPGYIKERLKNERSFSCIFQDISGGRVKYYRYEVVRGNDDAHAAMAFIDITEQVSSQIELKQAQERSKISDVINVLSSEYNAVYYCNEDTHDYDILFQQGFVKEELQQLKVMCPRYEDGFRFYIKMFVHPDDRENMALELSNVPNLLRTRKSVRIEFRRLYGDKYLYTEMYVVKTGNAEDELHAFVAGFAENDEAYREKIEKQKQLEYMVSERTQELENKNRALNDINEEIIELLGNLTEARDPESGEHIRRVKGFTKILAQQVMNDYPEYGLRPDIVELMTSASALHDIGKIRIPDSILLKPGRLTPDETEIMMTHCVKGCEMLRHAPAGWSSSYLKIGMDICHYHHERYDGNGYPEGLSGEEIPISAQIVAVADCFDALTQKRVYKDAIDLKTAFQMILNGECGVFSDKIMAAFVACRDKLFAHAGDTASLIHSKMPAGLSNSSLSLLKILLVDDNDINRDLSRDILEAEGAEVTCVRSGKEALDTFAASEVNHFDAILMDVFMPEMDGTEATKEIRKLERKDAAVIPIIGLTALTSEEDIEFCISAGMDSYVTKPLSVQALDRVLFECIGKNSENLNAAVTQAEKEASERIDRLLQREMFLTGINPEYSFVCYINGKTNTITGIRCNSIFQNAFGGTNPRLPVNKRLDRMFRNIIPNKDFPRFIDDTERTRIVTYLTQSDYYLAFAPFLIDGDERLYQLRFSRDTENSGAYLLTIKSASDDAKSAFRSRNLLSVLADSYLVFDVVDFVEDRFTRYQSFDADSRAPVLAGTYSLTFNKYLAENIYEEDRDRMYAYFNPDNIRNQLRTNKIISTRYRSNRDGSLKYRELQFVSTGEGEDVRYAILTISDVDAIVRQEIEETKLLEETQSQLFEAKRRATHDALTGLKNFNAYTDLVSSLYDRIRHDKNTEFAIVVCDINNLKGVNDSQGHAAGDIYIKNCGGIICDVLKRSPVFRIGGDEFCAVLTGDNYRNRESLMARLKARMLSASEIGSVENGRASFASGIAVFNSDTDTSVTDVVKRADAEMYADKAKMRSDNQ